MIDELDRCRPDFALSVLETVKHFFNVDGIHFILGTNLSELENSVRKRYGSSAGAARYLQKFVSISVSIPQDQRGHRDFASTNYYSQVVDILGTHDDWRHIRIRNLLEIIPRSTQPSLRDVEKIAACVAISTEANLRNELEYTALAIMTLLQVSRPELFVQLLSSEANLEEVLRFFGVTERDGVSLMDDTKSTVFWVCKLTQQPKLDVTQDQSQFFSTFGLDNNNKHMRRTFLRSIHDRTLALFRLPM